MGKPKRQKATKMVGKSKTARAKKAAEIQASGGVVPIGAFEVGMTREQVVARQEQFRSNAGRAHGNPQARRDRVTTSARTRSRAGRRQAAIRDAW